MTSPGIDSEIWQQQIWRNRLQAMVLLATMGGFLALLGWLVWGGLGLIILLLVGLPSLFFSPRLSPLLIMRFYRARPIQAYESPQLWQLMQQLARRAGLEYVPQLYYIPSRVLNAFATGGRGHAAIAITDGLLRSMDLRELAGVLGHEMSHIRNNDLWVMNLADMLSRATGLLSLLGQFLLLLSLPLFFIGAISINWWAILLLITAPILSALAQLALARNREFDADLNAARLTGDPDGLASALKKLEQIQGGWMERLFIPNRQPSQPSPLRTHPETAERIQRLMQLKRELPPMQDLQREALQDLLTHIGQPVNRAPRRHINGLWH